MGNSQTLQAWLSRVALKSATNTRKWTVERLARAGASPTRSGPEGSSRNEPRLGRCPASHFSQI